MHLLYRFVGFNIVTIILYIYRQYFTINSYFFVLKFRLVLPLLNINFLNYCIMQTHPYVIIKYYLFNLYLHFLYVTYLNLVDANFIIITLNPNNLFSILVNSLSLIVE